MRELLLPAVTLLLSVAATYWFCLRPMRRGGRCGLARPAGSYVRSAPESEHETGEVARLRREVQALREEISPPKR